MYLSILLLPLLASLAGNSRICGVYGGPRLSAFLLFIATIFSLIAFFEVGFNGSPVSVILGDWINNGNIHLSWDFIFDSLTVSMLIPIMIISTCVQLYSLEYLRTDPHISRFFSILSLFTFAMLLLIAGDNLFIVFFGWEAVGLVSYLLVNFWYTSTSNNLAAMKALFMNKIGDWGFILAIVFSMSIYSDLSFPTIFALSSKTDGNLLLLFNLSIILAASAKSAQIGLHSWLAAAMCGPTPVSSLLHSSTMVTAGIFLLLRISPCLEQGSTALMVVIWLGSLTALLGAACGLVENDIKRIIAFSTSSQLGYLFVACGVSQYTVALTHLINHAFFKSLLFLASGAFIHAIFDQDIRRMGSLVLLTPITYSVFLLGSLSLVAFPFFTGFYSKDFLLEILLVPLNITHTIAYIFTLFAALLTATYSIRLLMIAMYSRPHFPLAILPFVKDSPILITGPMLFISIAAVGFGYLSHELFLGFGSTFYGQSIFTLPENIRLFDASFASLTSYSYLSLLPLFFLSLLFLSLPFVSSSSAPGKMILPSASTILTPSTKDYPHSWRFSNIFDPSLMTHFNIFNYWIMHRFFVFSVFLYRYLDKGLIEFFGPLGLYRIIHFQSFILELLATGFIPHYGFIFLTFVLSFAFLSLPSILLFLICTYIFLFF